MPQGTTDSLLNDIVLCRFSVQEYSKFRVMPINEAAVKLAENGKIGALNLLFKRHPFSLSPYILKILSAIPETIQVQTYCQLLPGRSPPSVTILREKDWVECEDMLGYIRDLSEHDGRSALIRTEPVIKQLLGILWPSTDEILIWYRERAEEIDKLSGQLENSVSLIDYGCRRGMYELQQFADDVSYLQQIVYSEGYDDEMNSPISLIEWENMSDYEKFKTILKGVKEENFIERLRLRAIPFMKKNLHLGREHQRDESFLVRWLKEMAVQNNIAFCSLVIDEWCHDVHSGSFVDEMEAADCALQCIYLCSAMDMWNTMASIVSKFRNARGEFNRSTLLQPVHVQILKLTCSGMHSDILPPYQSVCLIFLLGYPIHLPHFYIWIWTLPLSLILSTHFNSLLISSTLFNLSLFNS